MCGRFGQFTRKESLIEQFELKTAPELEPRYNLAPTQEAGFIRWSEPAGGREMVLMRWGLIPFWAKDEKTGAKMINARWETVFEQPAFRRPARRRRGLVPADGFYEWKKSGRKKDPFFFRLKSRQPLALAGLWDSWSGPGGPVESFTVLTTSANAVVSPVHERMPVIIDPQSYSAWLEAEVANKEELTTLLVTVPVEDLEGFQVGSYVNRAGHEGPRCLEPEGEKRLWPEE